MAKKKRETLKRPQCPFCGGHNVIGNGYHETTKWVGDSWAPVWLKRWKCKGCVRTFSHRYWREPERRNKK